MPFFILCLLSNTVAIQQIIIVGTIWIAIKRLFKSNESSNNSIYWGTGNRYLKKVRATIKADSNDLLAYRSLVKKRNIDANNKKAASEKTYRSLFTEFIGKVNKTIRSVPEIVIDFLFTNNYPYS